jgi:HK97 family phage prohead protease
MRVRENRAFDSRFELRGASGAGAILQGYGAVYNSETTIGDYFREMVAPTAFKKSLADGADVRALFNHEPNLVLGRTTSGTLRLSSDNHGLMYEIDLPDTQQARDLWTLIERGDVTQSSFSFEAIQELVTQADDPSGLPLRTLTEVRLYDVSPVTYPAYEDTEVMARSAIAAMTHAGVWTPRSDATTEEPQGGPAEPPASTPQPEQEPTGLRVSLAAFHLLQFPPRS